ncbi:MAG: lipoyl synthase, partial [Candidatus Binatia bacterium]
GQLVGYPILSLDRDGRDVHLYLRKLEEVLIRTLGHFGLEGKRIAGKTGVWVGAGRWRKIASVGIGVRRWITLHGFALNVSTDLSWFEAIVPCGIEGLEMTSIARELGEEVAVGRVRERLLVEFAEVFGVRLGGSFRGATPRRGRAYAGRLSLAEPGVSERRKPPWLRARAPSGETWFRTRRILGDVGIHTVCQEAMCPNIGECWGHSTATFMLMGDSCTRSCGFCAVKHGAPVGLDRAEPAKVAEATARLGLRHVVVTSVNRDDLADGGAHHFAATAHAIKERVPGCAVEVLIPDFQGDEAALAAVVASPIDVLNHNTETVPSLYSRVRPGARYERSLRLLANARRLRPDLRVKSGLMVGLGERDEELYEVFADLHGSGCDILTIGQYLRPTREHLPVTRFVTPEEFADYRRRALAIGFRYVESGPLVRSSYHAWQHVGP